MTAKRWFAVACPVVLLPLSFWLFVVAGGMWPGGGGVAMGYLSLALFAPGIGVPMWYFAFAPKSTPAARAAVAVPPAREPVVLAAPDSGPGQCRVCGMEDLGDWADGYVVAYGTGRAHRDCEAVRPYVSPAAERDQRTVEHRAGQHDRAAVWNCRACADPELDDRRDQRPPVVVPSFRVSETTTYDGRASLEQPVMRGAISLRVNRDPGVGHFRLGDPIDSGRFEVVEVVKAHGRAGASTPCTVELAEPLRCEYRAYWRVILDPMPEDRLFNHDAGRPYTHVELGMACDCDRCVAVVDAGPPIDRRTLPVMQGVLSPGEARQLIAERGSQ